MHVARHRRRHLLRHPRRRLGRQGRQAGRGQRPRLQPQGGAGTAQDGGPDAQPQGDRLHRRPLHRQGVRVQGLRRQEAHPPLARRGHLHRQGAPAPSDAAQAGLARRAHVHLRLDGRPEGRDDPAEAAPCPDGRPCPRHARGGAGPVRQPRHAHRLLAAGPHLRARHRVRLLRLGARGWLRGPEDASARAREVQADRLARGVPADAHGGRAPRGGGSHSAADTFSASASGTYATIASCCTPAEKTILPTRPLQPLRSSASGSGSAFIAVMLASSKPTSPSGLSRVVQKKSNPPMSAAPSISTPFLPPSLATLLSSFSLSAAAALPAVDASPPPLLLPFPLPPPSSAAATAFSAALSTSLSKPAPELAAAGTSPQSTIVTGR
mmetsp:Transcript_920/g.3298  ORF Transcript_920/g.3298 Transcript_920/m.3298 type:complete len:381 (-) Transcript_920:302-1444(-)